MATPTSHSEPEVVQVAYFDVERGNTTESQRSYYLDTCLGLGSQSVVQYQEVSERATSELDVAFFLHVKTDRVLLSFYIAGSNYDYSPVR